MTKILLITPAQFGYHSGTFYFAKYLKYRFDVTVLGFDWNKKIFSIDEIKVVNIPYKRRYISQFELIRTAISLHNTFKYQFIFVLYFPLSSILSFLLSKVKIAVYVNTSPILTGKPITEKLYKLLLKLEYKMFNYRAVVSGNLATYLKLTNYKIIPLGAEYPELLPDPKIYNELKLIYVGTLYDRHIEITLKGVKLFLSRYLGIKLTYRIIAFGSKREIETLKDEISRLELNNNVYFLGEIRQHELRKYLSESNIGVSFIPCVERYDNQPPTKTFEYLAYGMPVIATRTKENVKVINDLNGVLIEDTPDGFCDGLIHIMDNIHIYNSKGISEYNRKYSWENIVNNIFYPYILESLEK